MRPDRAGDAHAADPSGEAARTDGGRDALLEVEGLTTVFHTDKETIRAVDDVSFTVEEGRTLGIVGESGSGKSVTARSILGLVDSPGVIESGSIRFRGDELTDDNWNAHRGDISIVFQDPSNSLNPVYTVGNQIRETLRIHQGLRGQAAREEAVRLLESVGIPDARRRVTEYPHQFSGGMRQRAVIAVALACDPDLLVCDEPTTALDVTIQAQILELLDELQEEEDLAIMFITHDMGVIEETADRVNVMYAGEIVESAPVDELFDSPQHPYTRGLLASIPGRTVSGDRLPTIGGEVPTPTTEPTDCRFAARCPEAFEACERVHPEPVRVGPDHAAACLLHEEGYDQGFGDSSVGPAPGGSGDGTATDGDAATDGGERE